MSKIFSLILLFVFQVITAQEVESGISENLQLLNKSKAAQDNISTAKYLSKLAFLYWQKEDLETAIEYFKECIKSNEALGNSNAIRILCSNIGLVYIEKGDYVNAITFINKSLRINRQMNKKEDLLGDIINISEAYHSTEKYIESIKLLEEGILIAKELNQLKSLRSCYTLIASAYQNTGNSVKSQEYFELGATISSHLQKKQLNEYESRTNSAEQTVAVKDVELKKTTDNLNEAIQINTEKQLQINLLNKEKELKELQIKAQKEREEALLKEEARRNKVIIWLSIILIVVAGLLFTIFSQLKKIKKAFLLIGKQKIEIEQQHQISIELNRKVTDSIMYASRIQKAILPPEDQIVKLLPQHFLIYRPKNIVSGDFYWLAEKENIVIVAIADCTGHGVPGAFMSMLGISFLNEIVNKLDNGNDDWRKPNIVLNELRKNVIESLHQNSAEGTSKDGMDISLMMVDTKNGILKFSGAHNNLFIVRKHEFIILDADKMPIGMHPHADRSFNEKEILLHKNDMIYMCSDGYADQIGGDRKAKFLTVNLKKLFAEIAILDLSEQKEILLTKHDQWKNKLEQVDDILLFGWRFC